MTSKKKASIKPGEFDGERNGESCPSPRRGSPKGLSFLIPRSLRGKMILAFFTVFLVTSMGAFAFLYTLSNVESKIQVIELFDSINQEILEVRRNEKNFLLYGNKADLMDALEGLDNVKLLMHRLRSRISSYEAISILEEVDIDTYSALLHRLSHASSDIESNKLKEQLRTKGHFLMKKVAQIDAMARQEVENEIRIYKLIARILLWAAIPIGALLSIALANWIMAPLQYIQRSVAQVMNGELAYIPDIRSSSECIECSALIESLNKMLTSLKSKQDQLLQSEKLAAIGKVTAGIAHEINNPLNNISLTAEVLRDEMSEMSPEERTEMVEDILVQTDRAREVVRHLLDFSRMRKPKAWEHINLVDIVRDTLALLKNEIKIKHIKAETEFPDKPVTILGNPNQLQQVFVNIILNAIQVMDEGGVLSVKVMVDEDEEQAIVAISDTGPGIPEDALEHIFEPFFTTKSYGTGLGLSVSYGIIHEHKGEIIVDSKEGKGSTFSVILPLWQ